MPGSSDTCPLCDKVFFGRQKFLTCVTCQLRHHVACLKISEGELAIYQTSPFKCNKCMNNKVPTNDDTPIKVKTPSLHNIGYNEPVNPTTEFELNHLKAEFSSLTAVFQSMIDCAVAKIVNATQANISVLNEEIKALRLENAELKSAISSITCLAPTSAHPSSSRDIYDGDQPDPVEQNSRSKNTLSKKRRRNRKKGNSRNEVEIDTPVSSNLNNDLVIPVRDDNIIDDNNSGNFPSINSEPVWTKVNKKNKSKPSIGAKGRGTVLNPKIPSKGPFLKNAKNVKFGTSKANNDLVSSHFIRKRALFATRFRSTVTVEDIGAWLKNPNININNFTCTKLKTKFSSYNSFHIEVEDSSFPAINDPNVWPEGILIAPFFGKLNTSINSVNDETSVEGDANSNDHD